MERTRRDEAQTALEVNRKRHEGIQEIEKQMMELAQLFQDLNAMVIQQDAAVENIDQRGEDIQENVEQANVQLDGAIKSASAARRKKFWCLGIARKSSLLQLSVLGLTSSHSPYHHYNSSHRGCCCPSRSQVVFRWQFPCTSHIDLQLAKIEIHRHLQRRLHQVLQLGSDWLEVERLSVSDLDAAWTIFVSFGYMVLSLVILSDMLLFLLSA